MKSRKKSKTEKPIKTKNVKIRRKHRFKPIKKAIVPAYTAPQFLEKCCGIKQVSESGVFVLENHLSNKLYLVNCEDMKDKQAVFEVLRSYDFQYRFYYYETDVYLLIQIHTDENQDASFDFDAIEKAILKKLTELGVQLNPIALEDRLRNVHKFISKYNKNPNNNIMDYVNNVAAWKPDFDLESFVLYLDRLENNDKTYYAFYFVRFGDDISEMLCELKKIKNIECVMIEHDGISDNYLYEFFNNNFIGCNNELRKLKKTDPQLYEIFTDSAMRDTRSYSMVGINMLYSVPNVSASEGNNEDIVEDIKAVKEKIQFIIDRYDAAVYDCSGMMADSFWEFVPFGKWKMTETRVAKNELSCECLLFNSNTGQKNNSELNQFFM